MAPHRFLAACIVVLVVDAACASAPETTSARTTRSPDKSSSPMNAPLLPSEEKLLAEGLAAQLGQNAARPDARTATLLARMQSLYGTPAGTTDASRAYAFAEYAGQIRRVVGLHRPDVLADLERVTGPLPPDAPKDAPQVFSKNALVAYKANAGEAERRVVEIALGYYETQIVSAPEQARRWCSIGQRQAQHNLTQIANAQNDRRARNVALTDLAGLGLEGINRAGDYSYVVTARHGGYTATATGRTGTNTAGDIWEITLTEPLHNVHDACTDALSDEAVAQRVDSHMLNALKSLGDPQDADAALLLYRCHRRQDEAIHMLSATQAQIKVFRHLHNNDWPNTEQMQLIMKTVRTTAGTPHYRLEHWDAGRPSEHWRAVAVEGGAMHHDEWSINKIGTLENPQNACGQDRSQ